MLHTVIQKHAKDNRVKQIYGLSGDRKATNLNELIKRNQQLENEINELTRDRSFRRTSSHIEPISPRSEEIKKKFLKEANGSLDRLAKILNDRQTMTPIVRLPQLPQP